jgi:hypothetical protein
MDSKNIDLAVAFFLGRRIYSLFWTYVSSIFNPLIFSFRLWEFHFHRNYSSPAKNDSGFIAIRHHKERIVDILSQSVSVGGEFF